MAFINLPDSNIKNCLPQRDFRVVSTPRVIVVITHNLKHGF